MAIPGEVHDQLAARFAVLLPHLNERQRRLALAAEARLLGHGGVRAVARAAGVSETTVRKGVFDLEGGEEPFPGGRVRRPGGGRKSAAEVDPGLLPALMALVEPDERGDPMSPLRWTTMSLRHLAGELTRLGHRVSAPTVGGLLRKNGFSLQATAKTLEGGQHPDRDAQFRYINEQVKEHQAAGEPVISVDAKKKEQLGQLPAPGREWRPSGQPIHVEDHAFFAGPRVTTVVPYGIYDIAANTGWVNVGIDHDTAAFAAASIRRWWQARGRFDYPDASRLLITADAGGSNSYRYRLWKSELADPPMDLDRVPAAVQPQDRRTAAGRPLQGKQHPDGRGLPRPVGPKEREHLTRLDHQVQVGDGTGRPVVLAQARGFDGRCHRCDSSRAAGSSDAGLPGTVGPAGAATIPPV